MIELKSDREIGFVREGAEILKKVFKAVEEALQDGMTTGELDAIAEKVIIDSGGVPAFKGYRGFPKTACISLNEEVVHGIPGPRKLKAGDVVSFDVGVKINGYYADAARSWPVGNVSAEAKKLIEAAKNAFQSGVDAYQVGQSRIGDISYAIEKKIESYGFGIVREYVGHGIGRLLHEEPQVPNYGRKGQGPRMEPGLVLAIEPMVTVGDPAVEVSSDGWTVITRDRKWASHWEETVVFTEQGYLILTRDE